MKSLWIAAVLLMFLSPTAYAVSLNEDLATTIKLRGYDCGGRSVSHIHESRDAQGARVIRATCPNGIRYLIIVSPNGRMQVKPTS